MIKTTSDIWHMRGESMTRIETFFAAACAFAVTMVIISVGSIPDSLAELVQATKQIPAFVASFSVLAWVWYTHAVWSRRFGLEDAKTVVLSCSLILLILIYMYPLRIMMQGVFALLTDGYLPGIMEFSEDWQIRFLFMLFGFGFLLMSLNLVALYAHGKRTPVTPPLSEAEKYEAESEIITWAATALISVISLLLAWLLPVHWVGWAGYTFFLLFPVLISIDIFRRKRAP
ncbi:TMEM175 family protein [Aliidiomarina celeris]|uniref:TMEM175 family protein n=1 Tax=Aliidiomarina celeris TaxID=2249428 RepID=UPI000DEA619F|nr:TMEM175 family protein [Aliidiomarina celeris]